MPTCTVCRSPSLHEINYQLLSKVSSMRELSLRHKLGVMSLLRHKQKCLPGVTDAIKAAMGLIGAKTVLEQMRQLHVRSMAILVKAEQSKQLPLALAAIREARSNLELLAKLSGELSTQSTASGPVNITVTYVDRPAHQVGGSDVKTIEAHVEDDP